MPTPLSNSLRLLLLTAACTFAAGCSSSSGSASPAPTGPTYTASFTPATMSFSTPTGIASAAQTATLTNTGTGSITLTGPTVAAPFAVSTTTCGSAQTIVLAAGASCTFSIYLQSASGGTYAQTLSSTGNITNSLTLTLNGIASTSPLASSINDCSVAAATCGPLFTGTSITGQLPTDPIAAGLFHGYADPSMRKDPNSSSIYIAYSWAKSLADGTHVVDLHLASSANSGTTWTEVGTLWQSVQTTQTVSTAYSSVNDSSTETIDLLPIALTGANAGQTLWVQAHQSYLVAPKGGIYDQLNATNLISVTAVQLTSPGLSGAGTALLALGTAPEGRLGAAGTDPSRNITQNLIPLSAATSKCANWGQPTLWYQGSLLYLALECTEFSGTGQLDGNELAHFVYSTPMTPTPTTASTWTWSYVGEFLTPAQAAKLGGVEGTAYSFFTEPEFVATKSGLAIIATPGVFNLSPTATQPVIQYGCRVIPITLTPNSITLDTDATSGVPVVTTKITENDLYTGINEGPAACLYEPAANTGIVMGRKYEDDPTYGFYIYPLTTGIFP